jgi:hypothetical protein
MSKPDLFSLEKNEKRPANQMAGELGFEPRLTESESAVLPLNYSPMVRQIAVKSDLFKLDKSDV